MDEGATIKATKLSDSFTFNDYVNQNQAGFVPLLLIHKDNRLALYTEDNRPLPKAGQTIVSVIKSDQAHD
jgi:hypothetical protein